MSTHHRDPDPRGYASMLAARPGVAWWVAVLIAFVPTVIGVVVDLSVNNDIGVIAWVLTLLGVTLAALAVRRHALFTVMVQPPLVVLAALVIGYVIATLTGGITGGVLNLGLKLVGTFPLMLVATAVAAILGVVRLVAQPLRTVSPRRTTGSPSHL
ncbi:DUF6542 domain-containing protein [Nakamurella deserti]|uniref:DUF6542 domain-containing protein n=1 Tax=Nakamurella deserti TaxID=2164074 RepID=UPI0013007748|nr:DUF6542 domain-containing protein [Nakamurella deserti]